MNERMRTTRWFDAAAELGPSTRIWQFVGLIGSVLAIRLPSDSGSLAGYAVSLVLWMATLALLAWGLLAWSVVVQAGYDSARLRHAPASSRGFGVEQGLAPDSAATFGSATAGATVAGDGVTTDATHA
jgi:hypothetical protein